MTRRVLAAAGWGAVIAVALGWHPALREGAPLAGVGREIASDAARGGVLLGSWGLAGSRVPLAFWALDLSLLYIAAWGFLKLCPRRDDDSPGTALPLLIASLAGQVAATFASDATGFYFLSAGAAVLSLAFLWRDRAPAPSSPPRAGRLVIASLVGVIVVLLASPLDAGFASLTDAPLLPEAWFPIVVEFRSTGRIPVAVALSLVVAGACGALGRARARWWELAPASVLILGPSNLAKGLAAAAVVSLLARSGAGPLWRVGFLVTLTALFVIVALSWP